MKKAGIVIVIHSKLTDRVVKVDGAANRIIALKLQTGHDLPNIPLLYAAKVGKLEEDEDTFWEAVTNFI